MYLSQSDDLYFFIIIILIYAIAWDLLISVSSISSDETFSQPQTDYQD